MPSLSSLIAFVALLVSAGQRAAPGVLIVLLEQGIRMGAGCYLAVGRDRHFPVWAGGAFAAALMQSSVCAL